MEREIRGAYGVGTRARAWVRALRPLAQGNLAPYWLVGALTGRREGLAVSGLGLTLAFLWGVFDHGAIVLANDLGDEEADRLSHGATLLSGGSRVLLDGALDRRALTRGLTVCVVGLGLVTALACRLFPSRSPVLVLCTLAALVLLYAYGHGPRLSYRGGGEWLQALGVGVVLPTVGAAMQTAHAPYLAPHAYAALVLVGLAGNVATSLPDAEDDAAAQKWSPAARLGVTRAFALSLALNVVAMLLAAWVETRAVLVAAPLFVVAALQAPRLAARETRMRAVYPLAFGGGAVVLAWALSSL
jgi:1,4-dihydroxy-2-naphthoate octaprenyltransferase